MFIPWNEIMIIVLSVIAFSVALLYSLSKKNILKK